MILDLEDICLEICPAIGNTAFGIGIGITYEQEENASSGHLQDDGVLVYIIREGGGWVEDRERVRPGSASAWPEPGRAGRMPAMTPAQQEERLRNILFSEGPYSRAKEDEIVECSLDTEGRYGRTAKRIGATCTVKRSGHLLTRDLSQKWIPSVSAGAAKIGSIGLNWTETKTMLTNRYQSLLSCRRDNGQ